MQYLENYYYFFFYKARNYKAKYSRLSRENVRNIPNRAINVKLLSIKSKSLV